MMHVRRRKHLMAYLAAGILGEGTRTATFTGNIHSPTYSARAKPRLMLMLLKWMVEIHAANSEWIYTIMLWGEHLQLTQGIEAYRLMKLQGER
jgi:hypothetical protein